MAKESGFADRQKKRGTVSGMISPEVKKALKDEAGQGADIQAEERVRPSFGAQLDELVTHGVKKEVKNKRVSFLMYPSVYEAFGAKCEELQKATGKRVTKNDVLNRLIAGYCGIEIE